MKTIRSPFSYSEVSQSVPLNFSGVTSGRGVPAAVMPLELVRAQVRPNLKRGATHVENLYWLSQSSRQRTEFWESALFALLGASAFVGVAVSLW